MSNIPESIPKQPALKPAEDYFRLRREGIGFIEKMGSRQWTDYNTHDPGITILEALCYAISDLAYRTGWDIKDLLTPASLSTDPNQPFPNQAFFTAREILTINPVTPDDFRRLLIDLEGVRNAWVFCKECACDFFYYAWCEQDRLMLSYQKPAQKDLQPKPVEPLGLYEILLELENDPELGDLNDRKLAQTYSIEVAGSLHSYILELRFPEWGLLEQDKFEAFITSADDPLTITLAKFSRSKVDNSFISESDLQRYWRNIFYISFNFSAGGQAIVINNVSLRIFSDVADINQLKINRLKADLGAGTKSGFIQKYRRKLQKTVAQVADAKITLHEHRNLDEDYCRISVVSVQDVAVCADVEVKPDADIEWVQAKIWFEIEQYFNPPVSFYALQELMAADVPVEDIFNGPALNNGFIKTEELQNAGLKTVLRTSDIINRLMDIEGVLAVNNLLLSKYDTEGNIMKGAADPDWDDQHGKFVFSKPEKTSAAWLLFISDLHQPRLYRNLSRFLFFKNGLPFTPRMDEANDTLMQLHGEAERPKIKNAPKDLPIPSGTYRHPEDYYPLQYSFPLTYGIGPEGLSSHVLPQRRAQAKQLKAYLMVFEQLLGNALAQLAHTAELFSLDPSVDRTYFVKEFSEIVIQGYTDLINGLDKTQLESITETSPEFHERRNRFLNHLMARFGEQFSEYALLLTNFKGRQIALDRLIEDKISFLKAYPLISHDRGKAFKYKENPCSPDNFPGIKKRVSLLLGYPNLAFFWKVVSQVNGQHYNEMFQLKDRNGKVWFEGGAISSLTTPLKNFLNTIMPKGETDTYEIVYESGQFQFELKDSNGNLLDKYPVLSTKKVEARALMDALLKAFREIIVKMIQPDTYEIVKESDKFRLKLNNSGNALGQHPALFNTMTAAQVLGEELLRWSANERAIVVEHLLLRPKFPGDALYPACTDRTCKTCGDEDPYSFRLTFVMPGWTSPYNDNMELRRFAERTLQQETPAHLLGKICWVGNDGYIESLCDPVISELAELLITNGLTDDSVKPVEIEVCACAIALYSAFSEVFKVWYEDKTLDFMQPDALKTILEAEFNAKVKASEIACTTVLEATLWTAIQQVMVKHFQQIAIYGWQFERFEDAWCKWLQANAKIDWTEVRLQQRVLVLLEAGLDPAKPSPSKEDLCKCAAKIISDYAVTFYDWMQQKIADITDEDSWEVFGDLPQPIIAACNNVILSEPTIQKLTELLVGRTVNENFVPGLYNGWVEVSYRLWVVVNLLSQLRNTYPGATLHDCDDGSDQNPVRLDNTALGNYPLRPSAT